jgi:hypothetical protein
MQLLFLAGVLECIFATWRLPLSLSLPQRALPQLAPLIWDSSASVRDAMADLLLCIS